MSQVVRSSRIFYLAPVAVGSGIAHLDIPPVRNKVLGVCDALAKAGAKPVLVTTITPTGDVSLMRPLRVTRIGSIAAVQVVSHGRAGVRRLVSMVTLWIALVHLIKHDDRVILYNYFPEYILAALWLKLAGRQCVIDIEDAPRSDDPTVRGAMSRISFAILRRLAARKYLIVSDKLARELRLDHHLPVYGIASHFRPDTERQPIFSQEAVRINFGGTLLRDTGINVFIEAVRILSRAHNGTPLHFFVTGHVPVGTFDALMAEANASPAVRLETAAHLDHGTYGALLDTMDVGLCLKLPSSQMGQTTFPSKVVEIAAMGLLLVTTSVSDVPLIFDESCAVLLKTEEPAELARVLSALPTDRCGAVKRARRGQERVRQRLAGPAVGAAIRTFLED